MSLWERIDDQNCRNGMKINASFFSFFFKNEVSASLSVSLLFLWVSFSLNMIYLKFRTCFGGVLGIYFLLRYNWHITLYYIQVFFSKTFFISLFLSLTWPHLFTLTITAESPYLQKNRSSRPLPGRPTLLSIKFSGLIKVGNTIPHSSVYQSQSFLVACDLVLGEE